MNMKDNINILVFFVGITISTILGDIIFNCTDIQINQTSGEVKSIKKLDDKYIVEIETECWHIGKFNTLKLVTDKNYQIGDTINFK